MLSRLRKKIEGSIQNKLFAIYFVIGIMMLVVGLSFSYYLLFYGSKRSISTLTTSVSRSKASEISTQYWERMGDIYLVSKLEPVKELLKNDLALQVEELQDVTDEVSERVSQEVEDYLKVHPDMTIEELQASQEFRSIAIQKVGENGYTTIINNQDLIVRFHPNEDFANLRLEEFIDNSAEFWQIISGSENGKRVSGFYDWLEEDGRITQKYLKVEPVEIETGDGERLSVVTVVYISDFGEELGIARSVQEYLVSLIDSYDLENLYIINRQGFVVWDVKSSAERGTNIINGPYKNGELSSVFSRVVEDRKVANSDIEIRKKGRGGVFFAAPIFNEISSDVLGVVVVEFSMERVDEILSESSVISEGEVDSKYYIVDEDGSVIATSENVQGYEFSRKIVDNKNKRLCFEDYDEYLGSRGLVEEHEEPVITYKDESGERVLGAHAYVEDMEACLLAEVSDQVILRQIRSIIPIYIVIAVVYVATIFYVARKLGMMVSSPIKTIQTGLGKMINGDLDVQITVEGDDELAKLAKDFNIMSEMILKSKQDLERLVRVRTKRLQKALDLMVGRELKMAEIKKEIDALKDLYKEDAEPAKHEEKDDE